MPAPAVYVLAIVGTVGAVLAFKEFVYEPHIAPAIDRWKHEYQAARRRREAAANSSEGDLLMSQTDSRVTEPADIHKPSDGDDDSDDDKPLSELDKGFKGSPSKYVRGSLLLRRPERATSSSQNTGDVELDDFVAREVSEWRNEDSTQVLRQRKNASEHAMDESLHAIPYTPLSPSRTHVVFDPSVPSTPGTGSRPASLPHSPFSPRSRPLQEIDSPAVVEVSQQDEPRISQSDATRQIANPKSPALALPASPRAVISPPPIEHTISPQPEASPFQHTITQSTLLTNTTTTTTTPTSSSPSITRSNISISSHPLQESYNVPSLSQSYPQDLDYEHGLELLSPPSSRSESPFSMANLSPEIGPDRNQGLRALSLSPFATTRSNLSSSAFSSAISSPSPLLMGLGNESFDAVSPILEPQRVFSQSVSPFPQGVPSLPIVVVDGPVPSPGPSVTNSARSTAYLSFSEDSEDEAAVQSRPPGNLGASFHSPSLSPRSRSLNSSQSGPSRHISESTHGNIEQGLGLFPTQAQSSSATPTNVLQIYSSPPSLSASSHSHTSHIYSPPSNSASPRTNHSPGYRGHGLGLGTLHPAPAPSDGELSDLDLMSDLGDFTPSEGLSDLGNDSESDSSWSMAGGSAVSSPRMNSNPGRR